MSRSTHCPVPGVPLHIVQRGHSRCPVFFGSTDYSRYLMCLREAAQRFRLAVHGYVLMTNHVHLLVTPGNEESLGRSLQSLNRRYVRYINDREGRSGTLWEGRRRLAVIDSEAYFLTCLRYIELNPVRAGMVVDPAAYAWSSHRHHALGQSDALIRSHPVYLTLGPTPRERQQAYRDLIGTTLPEEALKSIRAATRANRPLSG